ncbi:hypothetical protein FACS189472_07120 [Alphaproteobacteria bacterium]|nr:hypothetical protein FACS189472_07120 [Alphaproteobacteria bacterium]
MPSGNAIDSASDGTNARVEASEEFAISENGGIAVNVDEEPSRAPVVCIRVTASAAESSAPGDSVRKAGGVYDALITCESDEAGRLWAPSEIRLDALECIASDDDDDDDDDDEEDEDEDDEKGVGVVDSLSAEIGAGEGDDDEEEAVNVDRSFSTVLAVALSTRRFHR